MLSGGSPLVPSVYRSDIPTVEDTDSVVGIPAVVAEDNTAALASGRSENCRTALAPVAVVAPHI